VEHDSNTVHENRNGRKRFTSMLEERVWSADTVVYTDSGLQVSAVTYAKLQE
jgi:hypothetical protein